MIEARDLVKRYGSATAVSDLSFSVRPGMVTGFLGPNGAGKTTTMRMIVGPDAPAQGSVLRIAGLEGVARRRAQGFSLGMGQRPGIAPALLGDPAVLIFDEPVNGLGPGGRAGRPLPPGRPRRHRDHRDGQRRGGKAGRRPYPTRLGGGPVTSAW